MKKNYYTEYQEQKDKLLYILKDHFKIISKCWVPEITTMIGNKNTLNIGGKIKGIGVNSISAVSKAQG